MSALTINPDGENIIERVVPTRKPAEPGALGNIAKDQSAVKTPTNALGLDDATLSALGGIDKVTAAVALAEKLSGPEDKFDPALAALLYFTKMGEIASKPGATLLGSVAGAGVAPAQYLMQKKKEERDRRAKVGPLAISLAGTLSKSPGKSTLYNIDGRKVRLTDAQVGNLPQEDKNKLIEIKPKGAGTRPERAQQLLIKLAPAIADGTASAEEKQDYYMKYMEQSNPKESTRVVDGETITEFEPGLDLTLIPGLPIPEGYDPKKVLNRKNRKFDKSQLDSAGFGNRMLITEGTVRSMLQSGYEVNASDVAKIRGLSVLGFGAFKTAGLSPEAQRFHNAASNFVAAQLREESGAAIGPQEYADAIEQYFPQVGSSPEVILDKQGLRESLILGMIAAGGDAFRVNHPSAAPFMFGMKDGKKVDVINPVGYHLTVNARTKSGRGIHFETNLDLLEIDELKKMLGAGAERFTDDQIELISKKIKEKQGGSN
jgi:hypothetical protein